MRTFAQKPKATQQSTSTKSTMMPPGHEHGRVHTHSPAPKPASQYLAKAPPVNPPWFRLATSSDAGAALGADVEAAASRPVALGRQFDFSSIPVMPPDDKRVPETPFVIRAGRASPQPELEVGAAPDGSLEREANRIGARIGAALGPGALTEGH